jgi:hypothetical protein
MTTQAESTSHTDTQSQASTPPTQVTRQFVVRMQINALPRDLGAIARSAAAYPHKLPAIFAQYKASIRQVDTFVKFATTVAGKSHTVIHNDAIPECPIARSFATKGVSQGVTRLPVPLPKGDVRCTRTLTLRIEYFDTLDNLDDMLTDIGQSFATVFKKGRIRKIQSDMLFNLEYDATGKGTGHRAWSKFNTNAGLPMDAVQQAMWENRNQDR